MERTHPVYKILRDAEWEALRASGETAGSPDDIASGFVHLSTAAQLEGTLSRHFANEAGLHVLSLDTAAIAEALKWEPSRDGALFPHLYGPLRLADVRAAGEVSAGAEGHALPDLDRLPPLR